MTKEESKAVIRKGLKKVCIDSTENPGGQTTNNYNPRKFKLVCKEIGFEIAFNPYHQGCLQNLDLMMSFFELALDEYLK